MKYLCTILFFAIFVLCGSAQEIKEAYTSISCNESIGLENNGKKELTIIVTTDTLKYKTRLNQPYSTYVIKKSTDNYYVLKNALLGDFGIYNKESEELYVFIGETLRLYTKDYTDSKQLYKESCDLHYKSSQRVVIKNIISSIEDGF